MFSIKTKCPFAYDSADFKDPLGSAQDYHTSPEFIRASINLINKKTCNILDLGCANGSLIVDYLKAGHNAVGVDGSDYGVKNKTGGWKTNPKSFLNADITKPFEIVYERNKSIRAHFDIITSFDCFEHIAQEDLPQLCKNIRGHLDSNGLVFLVIATFGCGDYHRTVKPCGWWEKFLSTEFMIKQDIIDKWDIVNWMNYDPDGKYHTILGLQ